MPELPDITAYLTALESRIIGQPLQQIRLGSPFLLRTVQPSLSDFEGKIVKQLRRIGKRIAIGLEDDLWLVLHLMIAGRLHWKAAARSSGVGRIWRRSIFRMVLWCSPKPAASIVHRCTSSAVKQISAAFDAGGIDVFTSDLQTFRSVLTAENHTLKRALTDPRLLSGIGNAYSDEILHAAQLSPITLTSKLTPDEWQRSIRRNPPNTSTMDFAPRRGGGERLSGKSHGFPQRHGHSWPVWSALPSLWRQSSAHPLCRQRNELLRPLPDRREGPRRPQPVAPAGLGLASHTGRT